MSRRMVREPTTRQGICCGAKCLDEFPLSPPQQLYKVFDIFRWRCSRCYEAEVGHRHWEDREVRVVKGSS